MKTIAPAGGIAAIPTRYKGYHFRSRLEARWAIYFDAIGCEWEYEPQGYGLPDGSIYLPDFRLKTVNMWAEVKPQWPSDEEIEKGFSLAVGTGEDVLFLDGVPAVKNYWAASNGYFAGDIDRESGYDPSREKCWNDYYLNDWYLLGERRFYSSTCDDFGPDRKECGLYELQPGEPWIMAVNAARSARFEHGESGPT